MAQNNNIEIKIVKLINGDDVVCAFPKEQLPEKSPLIRLFKPLQIKYVPQLTPAGFKDYVALIKWAAYTPDIVVTIPKDKIITITNAGSEMIKSYNIIADNYGDLKVPTRDTNKQYAREKFSDEEQEEINELFQDFAEEKKTIH
jgi:hypothetical protein